MEGDDEDEGNEETEEGREESDDAEVLTLEREINKTYRVPANAMAIGKSAISKVCNSSHITCSIIKVR